MTSGSRFSAPAMFSPTLFPLTVIRPVCSKPMPASSFITAATPPASLSSSMKWLPAGARWHRLGVFSLISLNRFKSSLYPASCAMAGRCSELLVEQPRAISTVIAFSRARSFTISRGLISRRTSSMICLPLSFAKRRRSEYGAGIVPLPCRARPSASHRQFMELAVNIPEQEPQERQLPFSHSSRPASSSFPAL